jgi:hypothetical protein
MRGQAQRPSKPSRQKRKRRIEETDEDEKFTYQKTFNQSDDN